VGAFVGDEEGTVGEVDGLRVYPGEWGPNVGAFVITLGELLIEGLIVVMVGAIVGVFVGCLRVGALVGEDVITVGANEGAIVVPGVDGDIDGAAVGLVGVLVGLLDGAALGASEGTSVGGLDGDEVESVS
jgi:hypothetical protein